MTEAANVNPCFTLTHRNPAAQYWAMDLTIGDRLTVNVSSDGGYIAVYGPNAATIGDTAQCDSKGGSQATCLIGASGRYVLAFSANPYSSSGTGSFTPVIRSVVPQTGRVAGACQVTNAPVLRSRVTQYANVNLCFAVTHQNPAAQYWAMDLESGDRLTVDVSSVGGSVAVYGPNVGTIGGTPRCDSNGGSRATCLIGASGRYVLAFSANPYSTVPGSGAGSFTPVVVHPTRSRLGAPDTAAVDSEITIAVTIRSNTGDPTGTCLIEEAAQSQWRLIAHVDTKTGMCRLRLVPRQRGKLRLRARFRGAPGWASSYGPPVTLVVH